MIIAVDFDGTIVEHRFHLSSLSSIGLIVRRRGMVSASAMCFPQALTGGRH